jgi:beta-N-acetylhexosaminidase
MNKLGQLMMIGIEGMKLTRETELFIKEISPGGIILFRDNCDRPKQVRKFIASLRDLVGDDLIVAVDQEGGRVARLEAPFTEFSPMAALGCVADGERLAYEVGRVIGNELASVGFNLDFAPVLDVNTNSSNPIIGDRAFSSDPEVVARIGAEMIRGFQEEGVGACGKHFPGHGDTDLDSHKALPHIEHDRQRFDSCELIPFRSAIAAGVSSIMTGHLMIPNLDAEHPATFSSKIANDLLRNELEFEGLIFTDDLTMSGIDGICPQHESGWRALAAGADIALVCHHKQVQRDTIEGIRRAVGEGLISEDRILDAQARILKFKERFSISKNGSSFGTIGSRAHRKIAKILDRA